jgi:hypothetical protein
VLLPPDALEVVDYNRSRFAIEDWNRKAEPIEIGSAEEFRRAVAECRSNYGGEKRPVAKSYCLADSFLRSTDLFCMHEFDIDGHLYVSRRLRDAIVGAGITGIQFGRAKKLKAPE